MGIPARWAHVDGCDGRVLLSELTFPNSTRAVGKTFEKGGLFQYRKVEKKGGGGHRGLQG